MDGVHFVRYVCSYCIQSIMGPRWNSCFEWDIKLLASSNIYAQEGGLRQADIYYTEYDKCPHETRNKLMRKEASWAQRDGTSSQSILLWWWYLSWAWKCMHNFHCSVRGTILKGTSEREGQAVVVHTQRGVHSGVKGQDVCPLTTWARTPEGVAWRFQFLTKQSVHQSWRTAWELSQGVTLDIFRCH